MEFFFLKHLFQKKMRVLSFIPNREKKAARQVRVHQRSACCEKSALPQRPDCMDLGSNASIDHFPSPFFDFCSCCINLGLIYEAFRNGHVLHHRARPFPLLRYQRNHGDAGAAALPRTLKWCRLVKGEVNVENMGNYVELSRGWIYFFQDLGDRWKQKHDIVNRKFLKWNK